MSDNARRADIRIKISDKDITESVKPYVESIQYTDIASGESDSVSITMRDDDKKWRGSWFPNKGETLILSIIYKWWNGKTKSRAYKCGTFTIDDVTLTGGPDTITIGAIAIPEKEEFHIKERNKTWEKIRIRDIAQEIAARSKISLVYTAKDITVKSIEQNSQTDSAFLYELCSTYGLGMKVFAKKIIIFNEEDYEKAKPAATIKESEVTKWSFNTTLAKTYTGAKITYSDADKDLVVTIGSGKRIKKVSVSADSIKDAELKGAAVVNEENKKEATIQLTMLADPKLYAGATMQLTGFGKASGKYFITKITTSVGGSTQMTVSGYRVFERITR